MILLAIRPQFTSMFATRMTWADVHVKDRAGADARLTRRQRGGRLDCKRDGLVVRFAVVLDWHAQASSLLP